MEDYRKGPSGIYKVSAEGKSFMSEYPQADYDNLETKTKILLEYETAYRLKCPKVSDYEYDMLFKEVEALEDTLHFAFSYSPTINVGNDMQEGFKKAKHEIPMQSIENVYSDEELIEWLKKTNEELGEDVEYVAEPKYDGLACALIYKKGRLKQAITRGNQIEGDDVTKNVMQIDNIPKYLGTNIDIEIRGEVLMPINVFEELNSQREKNGEKLFVNPRNACSGSLKQLNPNITKTRNLMFAAYSAYYSGDVKMPGTQSQILYWLRSFGFYCHDVFITKSIDELIDWLHNFNENERLPKTLPYECDGAVIKVNSTTLQKELGLGTSAPKWVKARKYKPENQSTKILDVEFSVGTFGAVTPVLILDPIFISGTTVSRATINNEDYINKFDLHYGDYIFVEKSGEIIPKVIGIDEEKIRMIENEGSRGEKIVFPKNCPECGTPLVKDGAIWKCRYSDCPAQNTGKLVQFCSKDAMNIEGVGPSVAEDFIYEGIINEPIEIMSLDEKLSQAQRNVILESLGLGYGIKTINKIISQVEKSKKRPFEALLFGLCIESVGKNTAKLLANHFKNAENLMSATIQDLSEIEGIGEITAGKIYAGLRKGNWYELSKKYGLNLSIEEKEQKVLEIKGGPYGKNVLFSGTSEFFDRKGTEDFYKSVGCIYCSGVSKKLDYLIVGAKPGVSKVSKAESLGIPIISEREFMEKFNLMDLV